MKKARAGIILFSKNNYFLCVKGKKWSFPKGGIEEMEFPYYCALREFKEETGCDFPDNVDFLGQEYIDWTNYFVFYVEDKNSVKFDYQKVMNRNEISAVRWFHETEILNDNDKFNKGIRFFIEKIFGGYYKKDFGKPFRGCWGFQKPVEKNTSDFFDSGWTLVVKS